jgi:hypothetical protein
MGTIAFPSDFSRSAHQTEDPSASPNNLYVWVFESLRTIVMFQEMPKSLDIVPIYVITKPSS